MPARIRSRITYANVMSTIAVVFALGGGVAYAANTVFSEDIVDGEVKAADLAPNAVTGGKLAQNSVTTNKITDGGVELADLAANAVNGATVVDESLTSSDLGTNSVDATEVADGAIDSGEIFNDSLLDSDLATGSVRSPEILDAAVGSADIASNAVTGSKVAGNSLTTADIAGADVNGGGISVPTGYVPNGHCRQLDASVGGAKAGEAVIFNVKATLQDGVVIYGQRVPSDGHVMFDVCNFSGITQAQISNLPVRVITFG
jgi:hypothetical protein